MTTNNYDPATALAAYFPSRTSNQLARHWSREKVLHDWADLGAAEFFEGAGTDPTGLSGYALNKLWLNTPTGVTSAVGVVRAYQGGDPTQVANWPALSRAGFSAHIGAHGSAFDYTWSTSTSGDPGTGKVLGNNATLASVTQLNISKTGRQGQDYSARLAAMDDATTLAHRGRLTFYSVTSAGAFSEFRITGDLVDNSTYYTVPVAVVSSGALTNNLFVGIAFSRTGDKGSDGAASLDIAIKETRTDAAASLYGASIDVVVTYGYSTVNDGGGAKYKRVASAPSHAGKFQTSDGVWWELDEVEVLPQMFGAKADSTGVGLGTNDTTAIDNWLAYVLAKKAVGRLRGMYRYVPAAAWNFAGHDWGVSILGFNKYSDGFYLDSTYELAIEGANSFYWRCENFRVTGTRSGCVFRIGKNDYSDAHNGLTIHDLVINNTSLNAACEGIRLNYVLLSVINLTSNCGGTGRPATPTAPGNGSAIVIRQCAFNTFVLAGGQANQALYITGGFTFSNAFLTLDLEEVDKALVIDSANASKNNFVSGQFAATTCITATAGSGNLIGAGCNLAFYGGGSIGTSLTGIEIQPAANRAHLSGVNPAMTASTVAKVNATGQKVFVHVWAGNVSNIAITAVDGGVTNVNPQVVGEGNGFILHPGWSITLTYSSTPAWRWFPC